MDNKYIACSNVTMDDLMRMGTNDAITTSITEFGMLYLIYTHTYIRKLYNSNQISLINWVGNKIQKSSFRKKKK
jgi:hypothetical protein